MPANCSYHEPDQSSPWSHFLKIHLNIIPHLHLGLPSGLFPSGFPTKTLYTLLLSPIHAICPVHLILLHLITWTISGEQYRPLSSSLCSFLHSPVTSSLLGPNTLLNTQFLKTLCLSSSLNVSAQISHPYKTTYIIYKVWKCLIGNRKKRHFIFNNTSQLLRLYSTGGT